MRTNVGLKNSWTSGILPLGRVTTVGVPAQPLTHQLDHIQNTVLSNATPKGRAGMSHSALRHMEGDLCSHSWQKQWCGQGLEIVQFSDIIAASMCAYYVVLLASSGCALQLTLAQFTAD